MKIFLIFAGLISIGLCTPETLFNCAYTCPRFFFQPARTPTPNPNFTPTPNGCGPIGFPIDPSLLPNPAINECCNQHDVCYQTCNSAKATCDSNFLTCALNICGAGTDIQSQRCRTAANALYAVARNLACPVYLIDQSRACICT